ncbi:hypothetical protein ABZ622_10900 [Streptomyces sp. NPDC007164]|uniref:hypothetical protein n=1 Tax=Streptomyces sp. NPDC007164 TaxID=3156918 RepID=UPI0033C6984F
MPLPHLDGDYAITAMRSVPDYARYRELELIAGQQNLLTAIVPEGIPHGNRRCASALAEDAWMSRTRALEYHRSLWHALVKQRA